VTIGGGRRIRAAILKAEGKFFEVVGNAGIDGVEYSIYIAAQCRTARDERRADVFAARRSGDGPVWPSAIEAEILRSL
jgi:hypothetical protein